MAGLTEDCRVGLRPTRNDILIDPFDYAQGDRRKWIPACAGMTKWCGDDSVSRRVQGKQMDLWVWRFTQLVYPVACPPSFPRNYGVTGLASAGPNESCVKLPGLACFISEWISSQVTALIELMSS